MCFPEQNRIEPSFKTFLLRVSFTVSQVRAAAGRARRARCPEEYSPSSVSIAGRNRRAPPPAVCIASSRFFRLTGPFSRA